VNWWSELNDLAQAVIVAAAAVAAAGVLWQKLIRPVWGWVRARGRDLAAVRHIIERELTPNAGGSMKDKVSQLVRAQEVLRRQQAEFGERQTEQMDLLVTSIAEGERRDAHWRRELGDQGVTVTDPPVRRRRLGDTREPG
jgi:hypothetical protein